MAPAALELNATNISLSSFPLGLTPVERDRRPLSASDLRLSRRYGRGALPVHSERYRAHSARSAGYRDGRPGRCRWPRREAARPSRMCLSGGAFISIETEVARGPYRASPSHGRLSESQRGRASPSPLVERNPQRELGLRCQVRLEPVDFSSSETPDLRSSALGRALPSRERGTLEARVATIAGHEKWPELRSGPSVGYASARIGRNPARSCGATCRPLRRRAVSPSAERGWELSTPR